MVNSFYLLYIIIVVKLIFCELPFLYLAKCSLSVLIVGNEYGVLTSSSFNLLKSVRNRTVPFIWFC